MIGTKRTLARHNKLFMCILFMIFPLNLSANVADRQVAVFPFWGENQELINLFWNELFVALTEREGFHPVRIDMTNLPPGVPSGGFPPSVNPGPSLMRNMPFAITGNVFLNPLSGQWHLRLYLWHSTDIRPVISDELVAADRESIRMILPFMLEWLFSWAPGEAPPPPLVIAQPPPEPTPAQPEPAPTEPEPAPPEPGPAPVATPVEPEPTQTEPPPREPEPQTPADTQMAVEDEEHLVHHDEAQQWNWLYFGLRAGWNPQMFTPLWGGESFDGLDWNNISVAAHLYFQPFNFFGFLFLGFQAECIILRDFDYNTFYFTLPLLARLTAHRGNSSFLLLGGAYLLIPPTNRWRTIDLVHKEDRPIRNVNVGWGLTAGVGMGNRIGPGFLNVELRLSYDMFSSRIADVFYHRRMITVSIGYEIGFLGR